MTASGSCNRFDSSASMLPISHSTTSQRGSTAVRGGLLSEGTGFRALERTILCKPLRIVVMRKKIPVDQLFEKHSDQKPQQPCSLHSEWPCLCVQMYCDWLISSLCQHTIVHQWWSCVTHSHEQTVQTAFGPIFRDPWLGQDNLEDVKINNNRKSLETVQRQIKRGIGTLI